MPELKPLAIQLYSLRDALAQDFNGTIARLGEIGYIGVEPYRGLPVSPEAAKAQFDANNLVVESAHIGLPQGEDKQEILDIAHTLGVKYLIVPYLPPEQFADIDSIKATANFLNEANTVTQGAGFTLCYHNHWWEYEMVEDRVAIDHLLDDLEPTIQLQVDTYWVQVAGQSPTKYLEKFGKRAPLLHIKDGPANTEDPMVAVGEGVMDVKQIIATSGDNSAWLCVELDRCATDMMTAVENSYHYLTNEGLARGNNS